jgi:hypothetical protein
MPKLQGEMLKRHVNDEFWRLWKEATAAEFAELFWSHVESIRKIIKFLT